MQLMANRPLPGRRRPAFDHATAMRLAATETERFHAHLSQVSDDAWSRPTACSDWDVRQMACHVLGMTKMPSTVRETFRQMRIATAESKRSGGLFIDALNALQVREHANLTPAAILDELAAAGPRGVKGRARTPALVRRFATAGEQPIDEIGTMTEMWAMGFLTDVILTRDTWMHRMDLADATGVPLELSPEHDGILVADVAAEWAKRHGQACNLILTGPAGGRWSWGDGGPTLELDAIDFCRSASGRGTGEGLLSTRVPF